MRSRKYAVNGTRTNTATQSLFSITGSTAVRVALFYIQIGSDATADQAASYRVARHTADGTGTAYTYAPLDNGDPAGTATVKVNHSAEPTITANTDLLTLAGHQRGTIQWYAPQGAELVGAASASNGLSCQTVAVSSAYAIRYCAHWEE